MRTQYDLEKEFLRCIRDDFPGQQDYEARFRSISDYLNKNIHTEVEKAALLSSIKAGNILPDQALYLNNHGPGHVKQVMTMASRILAVPGFSLSPYEMYLLLTAIHFHDVGNVFGRTLHEKRCSEILDSLGSLAGADMPEKRTITLIAASHGGLANGDKDTIEKLVRADEYILGEKIRPQLLAAVLRFADELADDRTRASRFFLDKGILPAESLIFHLYSQSLESVVVEQDEIYLGYELKKEEALKKFPRAGSKVYLLDEIVSRTLKMHRERIYCMRFLPSELRINSIRVKIAVGNSDFLHVLAEFPYRLKESGYPDSPKGGIEAICPELRGKGLSGKELRRRLLTA